MATAHTRKLTLLALGALALSFVLPCDGIGWTFCSLKRLVDVDCPGCGLTRAVTSISHLEFARAWHYHPFGYLAWLLIAAVALAALVPAWRDRVVDPAIRAASGRAFPLTLAVLAALMAFGVSRWIFGNWWY